MQPTQKPWYLSRMVWLNALALVAWGLNEFLKVNVLSYFVGDPQWVAALTQLGMAVLAVVNLVLRFRTSQGLTK